MCLVEIIYSFKISSTPLDLLSLSELIALLISLSCIGSLSAFFDRRNASLYSGFGVSINISGVRSCSAKGTSFVFSDLKYSNISFKDIGIVSCFFVIVFIVDK